MDIISKLVEFGLALGMVILFNSVIKKRIFEFYKNKAPKIHLMYMIALVFIYFVLELIFKLKGLTVCVGLSAVIVWLNDYGFTIQKEKNLKENKYFLKDGKYHYDIVKACSHMKIKKEKDIYCDTEYTLELISIKTNINRYEKIKEEPYLDIKHIFDDKIALNIQNISNIPRITVDNQEDFEESKKDYEILLDNLLAQYDIAKPLIDMEKIDKERKKEEWEKTIEKIEEENSKCGR